MARRGRLVETPDGVGRLVRSTTEGRWIAGVLRSEVWLIVELDEPLRRYLYRAADCRLLEDAPRPEGGVA